MEVKNRMAGQEVRCIACNKLIEVPEDDDDLPPLRAKRDDGLSGLEFMLYALFFLFVPCVNVIVSSVLYYVWRSDRPRKASQINMLGFAVFGIHVLVRVLILVLLQQ